MAEFCLDCLRKLDGINYKDDEFEISTELDLCEGCGEWKHVVVCRKGFPHLGLLDLLIDGVKSIWRNLR